MKRILLYYNIKYLIKGVFKPRFSDVFKVINRINAKTNKNKLLIFLDMAWCRIIYLIDHWEYEVFEIYNFNHSEKRTVFTTIHKWAYAKKFNDPKLKNIFNDKSKFYKEYSEYIKREWLQINKETKDDLLDFIKGKKYIIGKNTYGGGGKQVFKIDLKKHNNIDELFEHLQNLNINIVEDFIVQHPDINELYPDSVNTIRIVTFLKDDIVNIVKAYLRVGKDKNVDNIDSGGILIPIDIEKGITNKLGADYSNNGFDIHPKTKKALVGVKVPLWEECINLVVEASKKYKDVRIVGWDVAITENGPLLIEGNYYPSSTLYQLPKHIPNKIGALPEFEKIIK